MKYICGAVSVWQEGITMDYTINNLLTLCDSIVILMDRPDIETEKNVVMWKERYPNVFSIGYSSVPSLRDPKHIRRRTKVYASQLGEEKLAIVKSVHEKRKIDILLSPDSDEVFIDTFPQILNEFWESESTCLRIRPISVYENVNIIHSGGMAPHVRAYKYREDMHYTPWRYYDFFHPFEEKDIFPKVYSGFVHLNNLKDNWSRKKKIGNPTLLEAAPETKLWKINKPAWELTHDEYKDIINNKQYDYLLKDYAKLFK